MVQSVGNQISVETQVLNIFLKIIFKFNRFKLKYQPVLYSYLLFFCDEVVRRSSRWNMCTKMPIIHILPVFKENIVLYFHHNQFLSASCMQFSLLSIKCGKYTWILKDVSIPGSLPCDSHIHIYFNVRHTIIGFQ